MFKYNKESRKKFLKLGFEYTSKNYALYFMKFPNTNSVLFITVSGRAVYTNDFGSVTKKALEYIDTLDDNTEDIALWINYQTGDLQIPIYDDYYDIQKAMDNNDRILMRAIIDETVNMRDEKGYTRINNINVKLQKQIYNIIKQII